MKTTFFKGIMITENDVVNALKKFDDKYRDSFPDSHWVTYAIKYKGNDYPPKQIMRIITDMPNVGSGGKPVNTKFEELGFTIGEIEEKNEDDDNSTVSDDEVELSLESDMEDSLVNNLGQIEEGLQLFISNGKSGRQFDTKTAGRIDLLAIDKKKNYLVIELKVGEADREVCGQIQAYMGWVKDNLGKGKKVRGLIIASDFTTRAIYAAKVVPDLYLKKYQVKFNFIDV